MLAKLDFKKWRQDDNLSNGNLDADEYAPIRLTKDGLVGS